MRARIRSITKSHLAVDPSEIDRRISGKTSAAMPMWTTRYIPNPDCWLGTIDCTCVTVGNGGGTGAQYGAVAITPRHLALPRHVFSSSAPTGETITLSQSWRWATAAGVTVDRSSDLGWCVGDDLIIARLTVDLPNTIKPAKFLPSDWQQYIPRNGTGLYGTGLPLVLFNQDANAAVANVSTIQQTDFTASLVKLTNTQRNALFQSPRDYDSGYPFGLVIGGEFVVLSHIHTGGATTATGPSYTYYSAGIPAAITGIGGGGGYAISTVDLASAWRAAA